MKIALPLESGCLSAHFGRCEEFAILEVDEQTKRIIDKLVYKAPPHEPGLLPRWLSELGVDVIVAGGMGRRAQELFAERGIKVIIGVSPATPEDVISEYLAGTLETGYNLCDH